MGWIRREGRNRHLETLTPLAGYADMPGSSKHSAPARKESTSRAHDEFLVLLSADFEQEGR